MKRSGSLIMPIVSFMLISFVTVYMGYHIMNAMKNPLKTVEAVVFTIEDTVPANGYFIRDEVLITKTDGIVRPAAESGERLAKGDVAFYVYRDQNALELGAALTEMETRIANLEYAQSQVSAGMDASQMDKLIYARLTDMLNARDSRRQTVLNAQKVEFESLVFRREYTYNGGSDLESTINALKAEAESLRGRQVSAVSKIKAEFSGALTTELDGFEQSLNMGLLDTMTVSEFSNIGSLKDLSIVNNNIGRQTLGFSWGHIIVVPEESAKLLKIGQSITLRFTDIYRTSVKFTVKRISFEDGQALVALTTTENVAAFINARRLPSDVVLKSYSGLRVPKEAIRLDLETTGVYCLMGDRAVFKPVEIIAERDNYYLVAFDAATATVKGLLPADRMIIGAKDIYNGKVYSEN